MSDVKLYEWMDSVSELYLEALFVEYRYILSHMSKFRQCLDLLMTPYGSL